MMAAPIKVLLLEADPIDAQRVIEELCPSDTGIQLKWAHSLQESLECIAANEINAILLGLSLPDGEGLDPLMTLLSQAPKIPVIVITSQADEETGIRAMQAGAQDYLIKGEVDGRLLTRVIQYAIQRKQTEKQLADALALNEQILTVSPFGILTYRLSGECVSANACVAQMVGATVEQLKQQNFHHIDSWKQSGLYAMAERAIASKQLVADDVHILTTFGKNIWLRAQFVTFQSGEEELLLLTFGDITERKDTEAALEASERRFRTWIENSSDVITVVDLHGIVQYQSPSAQHLLGYRPEEVLGRPAFELIHPEDQSQMAAHFVETIQNPGTNASAQCRIRHKDGSWRLMEAIARIYTDEHGELVALINSRDITERKKAEEAVAAMQRRFQALIENAPDGIALLGLDGRLHQVTPSTQQILGYTRGESIGQDPALLTHPEDLPTLLGILNDLSESPDKVITTQYRFKHRDGSWRWLESTISNLIAEPSVEAVVFNYRDITERKQLELQLSQSEATLRGFYESAPSLMGITELAGEQDVLHVYDNPATCRFFGVEKDTSNGRLGSELGVPPSALQVWIKHYRESERTGLPVHFEYLHAEPERTRWLAVTVAVIQNDPSPNTRFCYVAEEITERKRAGESLREKEQLLSQAQRIGHIGSWSYDIPADTMTFSDEMYRLLDVLPEKFEHNSSGFLTLVYPSDRTLVAGWLEDLKSGMQSREFDVRIFHQNGELRYLHSTGAVNFDHSGKPIRFIGTMQDITERRAAELQIKQQVKRLTALSEIDRAIMSSSDQRYTLGVILSQVIEQLQADAADVLLFNPDTQMLEYEVGQGFRTKMAETAYIHLGEDHAGRAAKERRMIRIADVRETTSHALFQSFVSAEGFVSYVGVPLIIKGEVKGVLEVFQRTLLQPYQEWLDFFNTLAGQTVIAIENAALFGNLQTTNQELVQAYDATIEGWSRAMDLRDRETEGHTQRVTKLTLKLAQALGMEEARLVHIRRGALLHDIGKLGVPDHILFKPGPLTPEEFEVMQKHTDWAYEMLAPIAYLKPALPIPYCHHEKWDGTGYPLGLKGEQIPLEARIFAVVDVWDALRSDRPYRRAWPDEKVLTYIEEMAGSHFDPEIVDLFIKVVKTQFE